MLTTVPAIPHQLQRDGRPHDQTRIHYADDQRFEVLGDNPVGDRYGLVRL